jgi:D-xylose transport system permease protein
MGSSGSKETRTDEGKSEPVATPWTKALGKVLARVDWRAYGMILVLILVGIVFQFLTEGIYLSPRNLALLLRQAAILTVTGSGVALLILMGEIDLSIGSAVYLAGLTTATAQTEWGVSTPVAVVIALAAGLAMGAWNGFWVTRLKVPAFVVTLGGFLGFRGLGYVWSNAATLAPMNKSFVAISEYFIPKTLSAVLIGGVLVLFIVLIVRQWAMRRARLGSDRVGSGGLIGRIAGGVIAAGIVTYMALGFLGIPTAAVVAIGVAAILTFITINTRFGRRAYAIGGNREASYLSGINIKKNVFIAFLIMGLIYGLGGILVSARLNAIPPNAGDFLELESIAAAVIGGISLSGGIGAIYGAIIGALLLRAVENGMSLMNLSSFIQMVAKALILLLAVRFDVSTRARRRGGS